MSAAALPFRLALSSNDAQRAINIVLKALVEPGEEPPTYIMRNKLLPVMKCVRCSGALSACHLRARLPTVVATP